MHPFGPFFFDGDDSKVLTTIPFCNAVQRAGRRVVASGTSQTDQITQERNKAVG